MEGSAVWMKATEVVEVVNTVDSRWGLNAEATDE